MVILAKAVNVTAFEIANNSYAKGAKVITLVSIAENRRSTASDVMVTIVEPQTDNWTVVVVEKGKTILSGLFSIEDAIKGDILFFTARGINDVDNQEIMLDLRVDNTSAELYLYTPNKEEKLKCPYSLFYVGKDKHRTGLLFHDTVSFTDFNDIGWKAGSIKQLKLCLLQNPYLHKL